MFFIDTKLRFKFYHAEHTELSLFPVLAQKLSLGASCAL